MSREPLLDDFSPVTPEEWRARVEKDLKGADFDRALGYRAAGDLSAEPLEYRADSSLSDPAGFPGAAPYTRGFRLPTYGADARPWQPAVLVCHADPEEANRRLLADLGLGAQRIWLRLGPGGVNARAPEDVDRLLKDVECRFVEIALHGRRSIHGTGLWLDWIRRSSVPFEEIRGSVGIDPVADWVRDAFRNSRPSDWADARRRATETASWCLAHAPGLYGSRIDVTPFHEAGASASLELACGLASGVDLLRRGEDAGLDLEATARRTEGVFAVGCEIFLEIAKLRAWRRLWARVLTASGLEGAISEQKIHLLPSERSRSVVDPWVNMLRSTSQVFVGAISGVDSVAADPYDALYESQDDRSARVAINSHHVLADESFLAKVADPAGGSWAVESLTDRLAEQAWQLFRDIERGGGIQAALESGELWQKISEVVEERKKNAAGRRNAKVGVSMFADLGERRPSEPRQSGGEPPELDRPESLSEVLRHLEDGGAWGEAGSEQSEPPSESPWRPFRPAEIFEALRLRSDRAASAGVRPTVALAQLGSARDSRARSQFATDFFAAAGIACESTEPSTDIDTVVDDVGKVGASHAVLCSSDEVYGELAAEVARGMKKAGVESVLLAGRPGENEAAWRDGGVDTFIYVGCDAATVLGAVLDSVLDEMETKS